MTDTIYRENTKNVHTHNTVIVQEKNFSRVSTVQKSNINFVITEEKYLNSGV